MLSNIEAVKNFAGEVFMSQFQPGSVAAGDKRSFDFVSLCVSVTESQISIV